MRRSTFSLLALPALTVALALMLADRFARNNATIVKPDIPASNGVIHVIETVLMPK